MEKLIARQAELYENLKQLQLNFIKDSDSRKTPEYLQERLSRLSNLWSEFEHNNSALAEYKTIASTEPYFSKDIFDSATNIYQVTLNLITSCSPEFKQQSLDPKPSGSQQSGQDQKNKLDKSTVPSGQLDEFLLEQRTNFRALRRLINSIDIEDLTEKWELEDELRNLKTRWDAIDHLHLKIDNILQGGDLNYEDEFFTYESSYKRIKRAINQKIVSTAHVHQVTPQIEIPTFTGKYTAWPTFFDLFIETIHNNNSLSKAQKMQHLKGKIKGEAERLIQHLNISAENYDTAWDILTHRYNNPQVLFTKQIETFLNQSNIQKQTSFEIKRLYDTSMETLHAIHNLGVDTNTWDPILVHILSKKLDHETYCDYKESRKNPRDLPALDEFMQFLENKFTALEPIHKRESSSSHQIRPTYNQGRQIFIKPQPNHYQGKYQQRTPYQAIATTHIKCPLCTQDHDLFRCKKFLGMTPDIKLKTVSRLRFCQNCLYNHFNNKCFSSKRCKECNGEHNTLLHDAYARAPVSNSMNLSMPPLQSSPQLSHNSAKSYTEHKPHNVNYVASNDEEILLTTLQLNVKSADGNFITLRCLLDQGSQISLISERAAQTLGLKLHHYSASISGIGNGCKQSKGLVTLECQSIYNDYDFSTQALVVTKVINNLPSTSFNKQAWPHIQNINLADPEYNISRPVDLLLDANVYSDIIMSGLIKGAQEVPIAQQTKLGWILSGNVKKSFNCHVVINNLNDISKYWEMEDVTTSDASALSREDQYCEDLYVKTTSRLESGNYEVATFNPTDVPDVKYQQPTLEAKKASVCTALHQKEISIISELLHKHNSITRAAKTIAWISRFIARARGQQNAESTNTLSSSEVNNALYTIIREIQGNDFKDDINNLKSKGKVQMTSRLSTLNPFLDKNGLLRVGGRLSNSNVSGKNQIIISNQSRLAELIIDQAHAATLHGGPRLTLSYIRNNYWVLSGMRTVKKQLRRCVTCRRFSHQKLDQIMADLPTPRVTPSRAFTHCGVDFTGFVELKANKGRGIKTSKGYIAVFVCLTTKAIHLELVSDLSTASFLAAFKRMCARRGTPREMYSDNGTNFIGAAKHLKKEYQEVLQCINTDFLNKVSELGINWHFNAPAWPSAGGLWESAVRSMKYHLRRVIGTQKLTYEEFTTLLAQIEACLNSRPLYAISEDVEDLDVLTPGHFLIGGPLLSSPESESSNITLPMRWQMVQTMARGFWKKWSHEYLQTLQTRSKWQTVKADIKINDVVLIKDENLPATRWGLARVVDVHPGKDGHVRVVTLKTKCGIIKRPITKLCLLPVHDQENIEKQPISDKQDSPISKATTNDASSSSGRTRTQKSKLSAFTLFLSLFSLFMPSLQQQLSSSSVFNVTHLQNDNQGLYFDKITNLQNIKDVWKLIVFYNMSTYWHGLDNIEHFITHLEEVAGSDPQYESIFYQLKHEIRDLEHYNTLLQHKSLNRQRRGLIDGVGYLANSLFGVLDARFAEKYEKDIIKITQNENHLQDLIRNQTIVLEAEYNVLKRNENNMNKQFTFIQQRLKNISLELDQVTLNNKNGPYITSSALTASIILSNLKRVQQSLLDIVTDISHGRIDTRLITPEQLNEQINRISRYLQGDLSLPVSVDSIRDIYKLLSVFVRVVNNYLIIEIKIPLVSSDIYEVNKIISIPQKRSTNLSYQLISKIPYIAYNMKKDVVILLSENDIRTCIPITTERILCSFDKPVYDLAVKQFFCKINLIDNDITSETPCISSLTTCRDQWIKLHHQNSWLFSCCNECTVRILCTSTGMTVKTLNDNGIISIGQGCTLKGDSFSIYAHNRFHNKISIDEEISVPQISPLNKLLNTSIQLVYPALESNNHHYDQIKDELETIKKSQSGQFTIHDVHHYSVSYVIIFVILVVGCIFVYAKIRSRRAAQRTSEVRAQQQAGEQEGEPLRPRRASISDSEVADIACNRGVLSVNQGTSPMVSRPVRFLVPSESVVLDA